MKKIILLPALLFYMHAHSQNDRVNDHNNVNWLQVFNTINLHKKWSVHLEYQWRRTDGLKSWQQSLLRAGINYKLNDQVTLHTGYGWIETFPYGDHPIASAGTFPEHRLYEQISFRQPIRKFTFIHRFRIEQRWLGRVRPGTDREIDGWTYLHRFRYQLKAQYVLFAKKESQLYAAYANEIFIAAGKNVGVNIFDQDRNFLLLGYKINKQISIEGGFMNQVLQQGRRVNNKTIMQQNNGAVLSSFINI
jgi:hypothetical protein